MINSKSTFDVLHIQHILMLVLKEEYLIIKKWDFVALHHTVMLYFLVFTVKDILVCLLESHK